MARTLKIDNVLKKRFAKKEQKGKKEGVKDLRVYFLIVCEGEKTEPNYFKSFPQKVGTTVYDLTFDGGGISTTKVVEKAIELRNKSIQKYDRVWAVFDRDSFKPNLFNGAIAKAMANDIGCAWSNEAFELWYLLHFYNRVTAMHRDEYKRAIERAINEKIVISSKSKKQEIFKYKKNATDMYATLIKYGHQEQAIHWSKELTKQHVGSNFASHNPCTTVYQLVEELIGKSEELNNLIAKKYDLGE